MTTATLPLRNTATNQRIVAAVTAFRAYLNAAALSRPVMIAALIAGMVYEWMR